MAEDLEIARTNNKANNYASLIPQIKGLVSGESDLIANLGNICAALKEQFQWLWIGFYFVKGDELVLGPFQGPVACTRISRGKGVCGTAWQEGRTLVVPDVDQFPGHIACSSRSRSEIVIPVFNKDEIVAVMDADSEFLNAFDMEDARFLGEIVKLVYLP